MNRDKTLINSIIRCTIAVLLALFFTSNVSTSAARNVTTLSEGWTIRTLSDPRRDATGDAVSLPHTWNAQYIAGTTSYNRETMVYKRALNITREMLQGRVFLLFEGANSVAQVFVNRRSVGEHRGGYTAFCLEITDAVSEGNNALEVWVSNAFRTDVLPISGDFNVYGGLHRPVHLITTAKSCINPVFYASPGVFVRQQKICEKEAAVDVETRLSFTDEMGDFCIKTSILDASGETVCSLSSAVSAECMHQTLQIPKPHLWNGRNAAYLYKVKVQLMRGADVEDEVEESFGLRTVSAERDAGFMLNGRQYDLHGFCRHEDFQGKGSALTAKEYEKDMQIIMESGATAMRLAHYPHGKAFYDLCDRYGILLMTEIPLCGPGGYDFTGYLTTVDENARQTARELVYQNLNHPSIAFWGIFNELLLNDGKRFKAYDDPLPLVREINDIYHTLDSTRLTIIASCMHETDYIGCSDVLAWNKYFNWKSAETAASAYFDGARRATNQPIGCSEYGAAAAFSHHADPRYAEDYDFKSTYHPEEYQAICHEGYWASFRNRPWLVTKFVWQFSDMQSTIRNEGEKAGMNDKGMVSYDRESRKDAFYFYKANWNPEPMLYLTSRRFTNRTHALTDVKAYCNLREATLYVNGKKISTQRPDDIKRIIWHDITLQKGENKIKVVGKNGKKKLADETIWTLKFEH